MADGKLLKTQPCPVFTRSYGDAGFMHSLRRPGYTSRTRTKACLSRRLSLDPASSASGRLSWPRLVGTAQLSDTPAARGKNHKFTATRHGALSDSSPLPPPRLCMLVRRQSLLLRNIPQAVGTWRERARHAYMAACICSRAAVSPASNTQHLVVVCMYVYMAAAAPGTLTLRSNIPHICSQPVPWGPASSCPAAEHGIRVCAPTH